MSNVLDDHRQQRHEDDGPKDEADDAGREFDDGGAPLAPLEVDDLRGALRHARRDARNEDARRDLHTDAEEEQNGDSTQSRDARVLP